MVKPSATKPKQHRRAPSASLQDVLKVYLVNQTLMSFLKDVRDVVSLSKISDTAIDKLRNRREIILRGGDLDVESFHDTWNAFDFTDRVILDSVALFPSPKIRDMLINFRYVSSIVLHDVSYMPKTLDLKDCCLLLKTLEISDCPGLEELSLPKNLLHLTIDGCEDLMPLRNLPENLKSLKLNDCPFVLRIPECRNLRILECSGCNLQSLDVGASKNLRRLVCSNNHLRSLDLSGSIKLEELYCRNNRIASLQFPDVVIPLRVLDASRNALETFPYVSNLRHLKEMNLSANRLRETVDFESFPLVSYQPLRVNLSFNPDIGELSTAACMEIVELNCSDCGLETLILNSELMRLNCRNNRLKFLNLTQNDSLRSLDCRGNDRRMKTFLNRFAPVEELLFDNGAVMFYGNHVE